MQYTEKEQIRVYRIHWGRLYGGIELQMDIVRRGGEKRTKDNVGNRIL